MIINATPHTVTIYKQSDCEYNESQRKLIVKTGAKPIKKITPSGKLLNACIEHMRVEDIFDTPVYVPRIFDIDDPEDVFDDLKSGDVIIVSRQYAAAHDLWVGDHKMPYRLACISQPVYDNPKNPRPIGCLGLEIVS